MNLAIIKTQNTAPYVSPVLAIKYKGEKTEVVAFDENFLCAKTFKMWKPKRTVYLIREEQFECERGGWEGYSFVLEDKSLSHAVFSKKGARVSDYPTLLPYAVKQPLPEKITLTCDEEVGTLMFTAVDFSKSEVKNAAWNQADKNLEITLDTARDCIITLFFYGVTENTDAQSAVHVFDSYMKHDENGFYWEADGVNTEGKKYSFAVKSNRLEYKIQVFGVNATERVEALATSFNISTKEEREAEYVRCYAEIISMFKLSEISLLTEKTEVEAILSAFESKDPGNFHTLTLRTNEGAVFTIGTSDSGNYVFQKVDISYKNLRNLMSKHKKNR